MAIRLLDAVTVDPSSWTITALVVRPAVKRERGPDGWIERPKLRDGVQGCELECLITWPGIDEPRAAKITVYQQDLPDVLQGQQIRIRGHVIAAPWGANGKSGLWFDVPDGVELASAPRKAAAS